MYVLSKQEMNNPAQGGIPPVDDDGDVTTVEDYETEWAAYINWLDVQVRFEEAELLAEVDAGLPTERFPA